MNMAGTVARATDTGTGTVARSADRFQSRPRATAPQAGPLVDSYCVLRIIDGDTSKFWSNAMLVIISYDAPLPSAVTSMYLRSSTSNVRTGLWCALSRASLTTTLRRGLLTG
jgi:hypothetical protein